ncbi:hypothetical protein [Leucobacter luti]|nr:hypothetical protein [Leucobacter luti]
MTDRTSLPARLSRWLRSPRTIRISGGKRIALASGGVLLAAAAATLASFTDVANLNLGNGSDGSGIGNPNRFDIAVVLPDGTVEQADDDAGYNWEVPWAETLIPGGSITTSIPLFNNTRDIQAAVAVSIELRNGDGTVADHPNITKFLRFTAARDGEELFADKPWAEAQADFGTLAAREADPLKPGEVYTAAAAGSVGTLDLTIAYLDEPETVDYNGGQSAFRVHFGAESTR